MVRKEQIAFLVGMPRAATTFMYHNFNLHPEIFVPYRRKTNYFSLHSNAGEDWFLSHFNGISENAIGIDTETLAFVNSSLNSPELLHQFNSNSKIILCLRNPADWIVSFYNQISTFDSQIPSFEDFLLGSYSLVEDGKSVKFKMEGGAISARVKEYQELFPGGILMLKFSDVVEAPLDALRSIEEFLGISSFYNKTNVITKKINSSDRKHSKWINKILRNETLITLIKKLLPRKVVLFIRLGFDNLSSTKKRGDTLLELEKHKQSRMLTLARSHYKKDIEELNHQIN